MKLLQYINKSDNFLVAIILFKEKKPFSVFNKWLNRTPTEAFSIWKSIIYVPTDLTLKDLQKEAFKNYLKTITDFEEIDFSEFYLLDYDRIRLDVQATYKDVIGGAMLKVLRDKIEGDFLEAKNNFLKLSDKALESRFLIADDFDLQFITVGRNSVKNPTDRALRIEMIVDIYNNCHKINADKIIYIHAGERLYLSTQRDDFFAMMTKYRRDILVRHGSKKYHCINLGELLVAIRSKESKINTLF